MIAPYLTVIKPYLSELRSRSLGELTDLSGLPRKPAVLQLHSIGFSLLMRFRNLDSKSAAFLPRKGNTKIINVASSTMQKCEFCRSCRLLSEPVISMLDESRGFASILYSATGWSGVKKNSMSDRCMYSSECCLHETNAVMFPVQTAANSARGIPNANQNSCVCELVHPCTRCASDSMENQCSARVAVHFPEAVTFCIVHDVPNCTVIGSELSSQSHYSG